MSKHKRIYPYSDQIYGALPFLYLGVGVLIMVLLPNAMGIFSGMTLVAAAVLVWALRYHHRRPVVQSERRINAPTADRRKAATLGLVQSSWQKSLRVVGCPPVVASHCCLNQPQREGVVQASREETAASATAVGVNYAAMGI